MHNTVIQKVEPEVTLEMFINLQKEIHATLNRHSEDIVRNYNDIVDHGQRISDLEAQLNLLKQMSQPKGDDGKGILDAMQDWINNLRIELNKNIDDSESRVSKRIDKICLQLEDFALKTDLENLKEEHEKRLDILDTKVDTLETTTKNQQKDIDWLLEEIKKKVNLDDFNKRLAYLENRWAANNDGKQPIPPPKEDIKIIERQVGPEISQKMIDAWNDNLKLTSTLKNKQQEIIQHIETHNLRIFELEKVTKTFALQVDVDKIKDDINHLYDRSDAQEKKIHDLKKWTQNEVAIIMKHFENFTKKEDHHLLRQRVEQLEKLFKELKKQLDALEVKVKHMKVGGGGADPELVDSLKNQLDNLRAEFEKFKQKTNQNLGELNITMPTKADKQDLLDLEARLNERLNEVLRQLLELIPNKDELNKKFDLINRKIKQIMEMLANKGSHDHEEDAMFSKKHLGPMNCASCEKDLVNIIGQPVDYYVWKRMPQRSQPDRIARYG